MNPIRRLTEIDVKPDGDEEEPQEQAPKGGYVSFDLIPKGTGRKGVRGESGGGAGGEGSK